MASGELQVKTLLSELPDTKVEALHQLFKNSSPGTYTEDNLVIATGVILETDISAVERSLSHLTHLKNELIRTFATIYAHGYHSLQGATDVKFDNKKFVADLKSIQDYRSGIQRSVETQPTPTEDQEPAQCALM